MPIIELATRPVGTTADIVLLKDEQTGALTMAIRVNKEYAKGKDSLATIKATGDILVTRAGNLLKKRHYDFTPLGEEAFPATSERKVVVAAATVTPTAGKDDATLASDFTQAADAAVTSMGPRIQRERRTEPKPVGQERRQSPRRGGQEQTHEKPSDDSRDRWGGRN